MANHHSREVDDYTTAFLWSAGLVVFIALVAVWATYGYGAALGIGFVGHLILSKCR